MIKLGHKADPLRGQNGSNRMLPHVFEGDSPKHEAKFFEGENASCLAFLLNVGQLLPEGLRGKVPEQTDPVDVFSTPFVVHQSNNIIENSFYFLNCPLSSMQSLDGLGDQLLRLQRIVEEGQ